MLSQKDEARVKIINIARGVFSHFGFKKTTMEEIAAGSRKGKSAIYYYFHSKEEIFKEVVEKEANELWSELDQKILIIEDPIERLNEYILYRMIKLKKLSNFYEALKCDYLSHLEFINKIRKTYDDKEVKIVSDIIEEGIKKGEFAVDDPNLSAIAIVTAMKGLEVPLFISDDQENIHDKISRIVNFLFYGIVKR